MEENPELKQLLKDSALIRGQILDRVVMMERLIDVYLASYFTNTEKKRIEILDTLFCTDRITLNAKYQIFNFLINEHEKDFIKKHPTLFKDIIYVSEQRNIFAHYLLDASEPAVINRLNNFSFVKFKNIRSREVYDEIRIKEIFTRSNYTMNTLVALNESKNNQAPSNPSSSTPDKSS